MYGHDEETNSQRFIDADVQTLDDFRNLRRGVLIPLHYNLYNKGSFMWVHSHVDGDKVWGRYVMSGEPHQDVDIGPYLYEFEGVVCRGSGAEPVCLQMPEDAEYADDEDYWL